MRMGECRFAAILRARESISVRLRPQAKGSAEAEPLLVHVGPSSTAGYSEECTICSTV